MKKITFFWMAACALVAAALVACSKEDAPTPQEEPEFYTVQLGWGGEIVDIAYEPLDTRATTDDLYGIQVYSKPNNNSTATSWEPYAYGLFDDPTNISIDLASGNKYKFVAAMVVDGKNYYDGGEYYTLPFEGIESSYSFGFTYSANDNMGFGAWDDESLYEIESFYGEVDNFAPSSSNVEATITMKRVSFGAKFIVEGALAKSGTLDIQIYGAAKMSLALTEGEDSISKIYTFGDMASAWSGDNTPDITADNGVYRDLRMVSFKWIRPDNTELQIGSFPITFKRNTTTVVTIKMENDVAVGDVEGGVGFSIASTEKGEMPVDEDNSVTITDGEVEGADDSAENA